MQRSKAESYIGFCIRAGKLTCGFNAVAAQRKDVFLLLLCETASENAPKQAPALKKKITCGIILDRGTPLEDVVGKPNCKLAAVRDKNLAKAILSATDERFVNYPGGNTEQDG